MNARQTAIIKATEQILRAREVIRVGAAEGDPLAAGLLLKLALDTCSDLKGLTNSAQSLAALKLAATYSEELPSTVKNPIHVRYRSTQPGDFVPMTTGENLVQAITSLLPFKIAASTGKPKKDDLLGRTVQFFVRGVHCYAITGSSDILGRIHAKRDDVSAWADEFVMWFRTHHREQVESESGAFHALALNRLNVKRRSQLDNPNGHSVDGDNPWVQFKQVVAERLRSEIPKKKRK